MGAPRREEEDRGEEDRDVATRRQPAAVKTPDKRLPAKKPALPKELAEHAKAQHAAKLARLTGRAQAALALIRER